MNKKGFSLIEVIVAIAIIGILIVPLLSIFTASFKNVISSGNRTKTVFQAQKEIDKKILEKPVISTEFDVIETSSTIINLKLYNTSDILEVDKNITGKMIEVKSKNTPVTITTFLL